VRLYVKTARLSIRILAGGDFLRIPIIKMPYGFMMSLRKNPVLDLVMNLC
jgi:hypothetical protein